MMIGWLIAAGLVGAAIASSGKDNTNYGRKISAQHKRCYNCGYANVSVYVADRYSGFIKLKFVCNECGRRWYKLYRIND